MTPLQRAEEFHERWVHHIITSTAKDFNIIKELKKVIEAAIKQEKAKR